MDAEPSIVCGQPHGPQARMQVVAVCTLLVYAAGMPAALGVFVLAFRDVIKQDQALRERGEGDSALTNPHFHFRKRSVGVDCQGSSPS